MKRGVLMMIPALIGSVIFTGCDSDTVDENTPSALYTLNFAGEGIVIEPQSIAHGNCATAPENPERENYGFEGWFTDNGTFANEWDFETDIVTQDTTLYAKWEESWYTLTFAGKGIDIATQSIAHGNRATAPENPVREGCGFEGWFTDNGTFANEWDFETDIVTQNTTLYAKWEEISFPTAPVDKELLLGEWELFKYVNLQTSSVTTKPDSVRRYCSINFIDDTHITGRILSNRIVEGEYALRSDSIKFFNTSETLIGYEFGEPEWGTEFRVALHRSDLIKIEKDILFLFYDQSEKVMLLNRMN